MVKMITKEDIRIDELTGFIERIEQLETEIAEIRNDIREIYAKAKSTGYDPKIMKVILRLKKLDVADRTELDDLTKTYREALDV